MDLTLTAPGARLRLTGTFAPSATPAHAVGGTLSLDGEANLGVGIAEETVLSVWLEADAPVALRHADPLVTADLHAERESRIVAGRLAFGSHVGRMRLDIVGTGGVLASLEIDVVPSKATPTEVRAMRGDVERAWAGAAFAAIRPATTAVGLDLGAERHDPAWLSILDVVLPNLERALDAVARRPLREVSRSPHLRPTASLSHLRSSDAARLTARYGADPADWPLRISAPSPRETADTAALRWVLVRIGAAASRATALATEEAGRTPTARRIALIEALRTHADALRGLRRRAPLSDVSGRAPAVPPLVLRRRPEHRRLYDAVRALDAGLDLAAGDLRPALRDLATLYETWCVLAVVCAAGLALGVAPPLVPLARAGADVTLRRDGAVQMEADGVALSVQVQPRFGGAPALLVQRPDLVLTAVGPRGTRRVVVDAKYRRDDSGAALRRFGSPAPPPDALGTLHRYRDAILGPAGEPRWIDAAVALFPHRGAADGLRRSIGRLGVGAIPLLPGTTDALGDWLADLVASVR